MTNLPDQDQQRRLLYGLLGDLPARDAPISRAVWNRANRMAISSKRSSLILTASNPSRPGSSNRSIPAGAFPACSTITPTAGIIHLGKDELLLGRKGLSTPPYAQALTSHGWAALCIDAWCFGERCVRAESGNLQGNALARPGAVGEDGLRQSAGGGLPRVTGPEVDANAASGRWGLSMGSTMAWWAAALEARMRVCVEICCLTDYEGPDRGRRAGRARDLLLCASLLKHFSTSR